MKMARRVSRSDDASGPRAAWWSVAGNARTRSDPGVIVPSAGGVRDARRAVGVVVAAGCAGEGGVSSAFASGNRCAVMRGKRAGSVVRALRSCASIVRTLACDEDVRFKTYLARRRVQRIAPRAPAGPCRETYARASSRSRPRKEHGAPRLRAPSGCSYSGDPRRAIDLRVRFPSQRSNRSGFAPDARGCVRGREAVAGGRTDADPMLARRNTRDFFRLPGSPAPAVAIAFFLWFVNPAHGRLLREPVPKRCEIGIPF